MLTLSQKRLPVNGSVSPRLDRALEDDLARRAAAADRDVRGAADGRDLEVGMVDGAGLCATFGVGRAGAFVSLSDDFQALITTIVITTMIASTSSTTLVSRRRLRRCGRARTSGAAAARGRPGDEAGVELVDVQLAVEAEVVGVGAQEALDVGLRRQQLEALLLERAEVLAADLRRLLGLGELDPAAHARLAEAVADLEHGADRTGRQPPASDAARARRASEHAVEGRARGRR